MKITNIQRSNFRSDFFGGLTTGLISLPLAVAFGVQSGLGAFAGLYGAIALGMLATCFGGTATLISGPTAPMTVLSAFIIATAIESSENLTVAMGSIMATFMLAGLFQCFLGLLKAGQYIRYIPYPVVAGFFNGIGVLLILLQVFPFLGHPSAQNVSDIFAGLPDILNQVNYTAIGLTGSTIAIIYLFPKISKTIPSSFVALMLVTIASTSMSLDIITIGNIPMNLAEFKTNSLTSLNWLDLSSIILPAISLSILGIIETLASSVAVDTKTKTKNNSNTQIIGQGLGNMLSAIIGGIPGAGTTMRSMVNINAGGKTRISGFIHGVVLLFILFIAGDYVELIPLPVLAGILITVGIDIINYKEIKKFVHAPRTDAVIMLIVLSLTVFIDLFHALIIGVVMALILFTKNIRSMLEEQAVESYVKNFAQEKAWGDEVNLPEQIQRKVFIKHFDNAIFLEFSKKMLAMIQLHPEIEIVIMRMERIDYIDQTGIIAIKEAINILQDNNILVLMTEIDHQPMDMLKKTRIIPHLIPEKYLYLDFQKAIQAMEVSNLVTFSSKEKNVRFKELNVQNVT